MLTVLTLGQPLTDYRLPEWGDCDCESPTQVTTSDLSQTPSQSIVHSTTHSLDTSQGVRLKVQLQLKLKVKLKV